MAQDILDVLHPVPVRYVAKGTRRQKLAMPQRRSPIRLTLADPAAFEPFTDAAAVKLRLHGHDGHLWEPLSVGGMRECGLSELRRLFQEWGDPDAREKLYSFVGTPVIAATPDGYGDMLPRHFDGRGVHEVIDDGAGAPAEVQAFFDREVRACGDRLFVRCCGPTATVGRRHAKVWVNPWPRSSGYFDRDLTGGPSAVPEIWRHLLATDPDFASQADAEPPAWEAPAAMPHELAPEIELSLLANRLVRKTYPVYCRLAQQRHMPEDRAGRLRDAAAVLAPNLPRACLGLLDESMFEPMLACALSVREALLSYRPGRDQVMGWGLGDFHTLVRYAQDVVLPRMHAHDALSDTDEAAMMGLQPGGR